MNKVMLISILSIVALMAGCSHPITVQQTVLVPQTFVVTATVAPLSTPIPTVIPGIFTLQYAQSILVSRGYSLIDSGYDCIGYFVCFGYAKVTSLANNARTPGWGLNNFVTLGVCGIDQVFGLNFGWDIRNKSAMEDSGVTAKNLGSLPNISATQYANIPVGGKIIFDGWTVARTGWNYKGNDYTTPVESLNFVHPNAQKVCPPSPEK
jgi:hypothetical protein